MSGSDTELSSDESEGGAEVVEDGTQSSKESRSMLKSSVASAVKTVKDSMEKSFWPICYAAKSTATDQRVDRGKLHGVWEFRVAGIGYCVGLGNLWRFPYFVSQYGGGSFLVAYWLIFFFFAFPFFFLELFLGQFTSRGPIAAFRNLSPGLIGVGWAMQAAQVLMAVSYGGVFSWSIFYLFLSLESPMKWETCGDYPWTTDYCFSVSQYRECEDHGGYYLKGSCYTEKNISQYYRKLESCIFHEHSEECMVELEFRFQKWDDGATTVCSGPSPAAKCAIFGYWEQFDPCFSKWDAPKWISLINESTRTPFFIRININKPKVREVFRKKEKKGSLERIINNFCPIDGDRLNCSRSIIRANESYSSKEMFNYILNAGSRNMKEVLGFHWPLPLVHILMWGISILGVFGGIEFLGKFAYSSTIVPGILGLLVVASWIYLDSRGSFKGIKYIMKFDICVFKNPEMWLAAIGQVLFSLGCGYGGVMTMASYNEFRFDFLTSGMIIAVTDGICSFLFSLGMFGLLGFLATQRHIELEELVMSGLGTVFVAITDALTILPWANYWTMLFFLLLCFLAIGTQFCSVFIIYSNIFDEFPLLYGNRKLRVATILGGAIVMYLLGLPYVSRNGILGVEYIEKAIYEYLVPLCSIVLMVVASYLYGVREITGDVEMMLKNPRLHRKEREKQRKKDIQRGKEILDRLSGDTPKEIKSCTYRGSFASRKSGKSLGGLLWHNGFFRTYIQLSWMISSPVGIIVLIVLALNQEVKHYSDTNLVEQLHIWGIGIAFFFLYGTVRALISGFLYSVFVMKIPIRNLFSPTKDWGPALHRDRKGKYHIKK